MIAGGNRLSPTEARAETGDRLRWTRWHSKRSDYLAAAFAIYTSPPSATEPPLKGRPFFIAFPLRGRWVLQSKTRMRCVTYKKTPRAICTGVIYLFIQPKSSNLTEDKMRGHTLLPFQVQAYQKISKYRVLLYQHLLHLLTIQLLHNLHHEQCF